MAKKNKGYVGRYETNELEETFNNLTGSKKDKSKGDYTQFLRFVNICNHFLQVFLPFLEKIVYNRKNNERGPNYAQKTQFRYAQEN